MANSGVWVSPRQVSDTSTVQTTVRDSVTTKFTQATDYASQAWIWTYLYADELKALLQGLEVPDVEPINIAIPDIDQIDFQARPAIDDADISEEWPVSTAVRPSLLTVGDISDIWIPVYDVTGVQYERVDRPVLDDIQDPGDAPTMRQISRPASPTLTLPAAPTVREIFQPSPPPIDLPVFDGELSDEDIDIPPGFSWSEDAYNSPVWNNLLADVLDGLKNGGTGLSSAVEEDIWTNARRRLELEADKKIQEVEAYFAAKGHPIAPGPLAEQVLEISKETFRSLKDLSRDIGIKQAELAFEHSKQIRDRAVDIEKVLREFHNSQMLRSLEAAKELVSGAIQIYNARVAMYGLKLEKYKTVAQVFESRIRAVLATVEVYRAQVDAAKLDAEIQAIAVDIYAKQVQAVEVAARLYTAQLDGARLELEMEKMQLEAFKVSTDTYVARLNGQRNKVELYTAQLQGEKNKAEFDAEKNRAFVAKVEAAKADATIKIERQRAKIDTNKMLIDQYRSELDAYKVEVEATASKVGAKVEVFKGVVAAYAAENNALEGRYNVNVKEIEANIKRAELMTAQAIANVDAATKGYVAVKGLQVEGTKSMVQVGSQLAASAMSSFSANASLGASASNSNSDSFEGKASLTESHGYQHEG